MRAVLMEKPWSVKMAEVREPLPQPGCVRVRVKASAVCGSDLSAYRGKSPLCTFPRVPGHELGGVVERGDGQGRFRPGQRVVLEPYLMCGNCPACQDGRTNCCESLRTLGVQTDGGLCEWIEHPAALTHLAPDALDEVEMALVEPLTIGLHTVNRLNPAPGEWVVVFGCGPIGYLASQALLLRGCMPIVVEPLEARRKIALEHGVAHAIAFENCAERVREITGGRMADGVAECSGAPEAVRQVLEVVRNAGRVVLTGYPGTPVELPTFAITRKELDIMGSRNSKREFPEAIELLSEHRVDLEPLRRCIVPFEQLAERIEWQAHHPEAVLKVVGLL